MLKTEQNGLLNTLKNIFESKYLPIFTFAIAFFCWLMQWGVLCVGLIALNIVLVLIFAKDVKNIFAPFFYVSFFIPDILKTDNEKPYLLFIVLAMSYLFFFVLKNILDKPKELKKGKMFYPLIAADVAFVFAGIIGGFNARTTIIILFICLVAFALYFSALNFTENLREYFAELFVFGAIALSVIVFVSEIKIPYITQRFGSYYCAQNSNVVALYILLGVVGCFGVGCGRKTDYIYLPLAWIFTFATFTTCCRMVFLINIFAILALTVIFFIKTKCRKNLYIVCAVLLAVIAVMLCFYDVFFAPYLNNIILKMDGVDSGRFKIWKNCMSLFAERPIFGYGFRSDGSDYLGSRGGISLILAHNTIIQYITSTGIFGTLLLCFFGYSKYALVCKNLFKKFNRKKIFCFVAVLAVSLSGITDQAASMDAFTFILPIILCAGAENKSVRRNYENT